MTSEILVLDVSTMGLVSSVAGFLMAATMLGIRFAGMRARAVVDWSLAGLGFGCGYLLGNLSHTAIVPAPTEYGFVVANSLITTGHVFVLVGVLRYLGLRAWAGHLLAAVALLLVAGLAVDELGESYRARIVVFSIAPLVLGIWAGVVLWRSERPGMRLFHRIVAMVLLAYTAVVGVRMMNTLVQPAFTAGWPTEGLQGIAFLAAMIFGFLLTMALVVMMFREKQVELMDLAEKDPLTGMNNRLSLAEIAGKYMERAERHGLELSVMLFDLDHFKRVNDRFGHQMGDRVLSKVAGQIGQVIRGRDVAFRFGGEEFLALLPGAGRDEAEQVAERLRQVIADHSIEVEGQPLTLTASFGVVQYRPGRESWDECVQRADRALYRAKKEGRDRVVGNASLIVVI